MLRKAPTVPSRKTADRYTRSDLAYFGAMRESERTALLASRNQVWRNGYVYEVVRDDDWTPTPSVEEQHDSWAAQQRAIDQADAAAALRRRTGGRR